MLLRAEKHLQHRGIVNETYYFALIKNFRGTQVSGVLLKALHAAFRYGNVDGYLILVLRVSRPIHTDPTESAYYGNAGRCFSRLRHRVEEVAIFLRHTR